VRCVTKVLQLSCEVDECKPLIQVSVSEKDVAKVALKAVRDMEYEAGAYTPSLLSST